MALQPLDLNNRPVGISVWPAVAFFDLKIDSEDGHMTAKLLKVLCLRFSQSCVRPHFSLKVIKKGLKTTFFIE